MQVNCVVMLLMFRDYNSWYFKMCGTCHKKLLKRHHIQLELELTRMNALKNQPTTDQNIQDVSQPSHNPEVQTSATN